MIESSSPSAVGPAANTNCVCYVENRQVMENWQKMAGQRIINDPTNFIVGLNGDQKTLLRIAGTIAGKRIRKKSAVDIATIVETLGNLAEDWPASRVHDAIDSLVKDGILVAGETSFRLTRYISPAGCYVDTPPKLKTERAIRREKLLKRFESRCCFCFRVVTLEDATIDHVVPTSRGGVDAECNWAICCLKCNAVKGARTPEQWARDILRWKRPRKIEPRSYLMSLLAVSPAFILSWLVSALSFVKGGVR